MKKSSICRRAPIFAAVVFCFAIAFGGAMNAYPAQARAVVSPVAAAPAVEVKAADCVHQYVYPFVTKRPTQSAQGSAVFTCALNSAHTVTVTLPKLGSDYEKVSDTVYVYKSAYGSVRVDLTEAAPAETKETNVGLIVGISVAGAIVALSLLWMILYLIWKKKNRSPIRFLVPSFRFWSRTFCKTELNDAERAAHLSGKETDFSDMRDEK